MTDHPAVLPIDEIARFPLPGMAVPGAFAFSPDGRWLAYLHSPERTLTRRLFALELDSGRIVEIEPPGREVTEESVTLEEALRRERMRLRETGITSYAWAGQGGRLLVPLADGLYGSDGPEQPLRRLVGSENGPIQDPKFSPDGKWVAFVQNDEVWAVLFAGGEPHPVTTGALQAGVTHGLAEYIAQEEMDRREGFWWSPDGQWIAFEEVDERHIPVYRIVHQGKDATGEQAQEDHRYPFAGQANAHVRLGVVRRDGGEPIWMDPGAEDDIYLAQAGWLPGGRLWAQIENREQTHLDLLVFDPQTGAATRLLSETSAVWINLHNMFTPLKGVYDGQPGAFLWASEQSGFRHLYLYDREGRLIRPLTDGEWMVDELAGVDEASGQVFFTATKDDPRQKQLYAVDLNGGEPRRLTWDGGTHTVTLDPQRRYYVDLHHSLSQPPKVTLHSTVDGSVLRDIFSEIDPRVQELGLASPELVTIENRHGDRLYGALYRPPAAFSPGPYPLIVNIYGGPHAQMVIDGWPMTAAMARQYWRSLGFLVFVLDNRGSARRGLDFEGVIRRDLGHYEVEDQVDGVRWLVKQGLADPERVGVIGWSYGGYMALMCLARAPQVFRAGVAGAPVTEWDGYDTHYTERYMGTPANNPDGYRNSGVRAHLDALVGKLLLVHGLIDENVHFRHTARLINALIHQRKRYDLLLFPDERHMPRREADRVDMEARIRDFFLENLKA